MEGGWVLQTVILWQLENWYITKEEFDLWVFEAFKSWDFACAVAAWEFSMLEPISSVKWNLVALENMNKYGKINSYAAI